MKLNSMSYKGFVWPDNPAYCTVSAKRQVAEKKLAGGGWYSADMGLAGRTISGTGEFSGEGAYENFLALYDVFCQSGPGELYHPVAGTVTAIFQSLEMTQKPAANYVAYSFAFRQVGQQAEKAEAGDGNEEYYTLSAGETFWSVGSRFSLSAAALAELNPTVSNPASVGQGDRLRVS